MLAIKELIFWWLYITLKYDMIFFPSFIQPFKSKELRVKEATFLETTKLTLID